MFEGVKLNQLKHICAPPSDPYFLESMMHHKLQMGVSENSVSLNPMVLLIIIPFLNGYFIGNIIPTFSDKPIWWFSSWR